MIDLRWTRACCRRLFDNDGEARFLNSGVTRFGQTTLSPKRKERGLSTALFSVRIEPGG
ncbi:hypothetical protein [Brevundimonas intermedia]|jgi:hypothetical protein|uniref:hypothetical protein n=1 Tax=Brevundimonas intermedia TaxID=74315 RepID=UPI003208750A